MCTKHLLFRYYESFLSNKYLTFAVSLCRVTNYITEANTEKLFNKLFRKFEVKASLKVIIPWRRRSVLSLILIK